MTKAKSKMRQFSYNGFTAYEVRKSYWRIGSTSSRGGYYLGGENSVKGAKEMIDRIINGYKPLKEE